ncbi:putative DNA modification/repair radical SAM protein [Cesiribacter andamanensis]|uniref:Putative DNA modification/repair radical SAM protein n=1 Tax=Cesiribacter andamanensis AMV16 TaxID=1279009 RepID=M7NHC7_9BACT|nr:putative DNA modification/repair radical SAM protein [Cesiribacter andamanensis]EMR01205.1 putative DNA modification/repair radical SAM protein [Cesiribacter andamanensis AMV16]
MAKSLEEKLSLLADAAKYDVSCSSSGSKRKNVGKGLGNAEGMGICHSYTADGRCVSLLKILLTNHCIFDCAYCVSRRSNDVERAAFTVKEVVELTLSFYRRNYIEGLFLSSGIFKSPDATMERLVRVAKSLRLEHQFNGYIHLKAIPGASEALIEEAGRYADRLSVNLELPSDLSLQLLAPEKRFADVLRPMNHLKEKIDEQAADKKNALIKHTPLFAPAGQSTQLVVGASPESDRHILLLSQGLYQEQKLKRVYYSGYVPISTDARLPALGSMPPLLREHRLYQADWLLRFYGFKAEELLSDQRPQLDLQFDPKLAWALHNRQYFPVEVQSAPLEALLRVPGLGIKTAKMIVASRSFTPLRFDHLKQMGVVLKRARYFITCGGQYLTDPDVADHKLRLILARQQPLVHRLEQTQLSLFTPYANAS